MGSHKGLVVDHVGTDVKKIITAHLQRTMQRCGVCTDALGRLAVVRRSQLQGGCAQAAVSFSKKDCTSNSLWAQLMRLVHFVNPEP